MTNKNPFEIRLDILKMAQEMFESDRRYAQAAEQQKVDLLKSAELPVSAVSDYLASNNIPKHYTEEDVLTRAASLYSFIDNKSR